MTCPICRKPTARENNPDFPFCSERCRDADLGKWASEEYRIPGAPLPLPGDDDDDERE